MTKTKRNLIIKSLHNLWNIPRYSAPLTTEHGVDMGAGRINPGGNLQGQPLVNLIHATADRLLGLRKFITSSLLCLSLSVNNTVLAEYKKPASTQNDAPAPNSTTISGTRGGGCSGREKTSLTALAPYSHIGTTIDPYPTFAWYVPDRQSYPVEFQLYEYNPSQFQGKGEMLVKATLKSSPGIMTYSLPHSHAGLTPGKKYVWQVAVVCNPNHPSKSLVVSTQIMVVEMPLDLTNQLNRIGDVVARADIYAENGLWYDALAEVVTTKNNPQAKKFTAELLKQLAVEELEDNAHNLAEQEKIIRLRKKHQEQLKQVLNVFTTNYQ